MKNVASSVAPKESQESQGAPLLTVVPDGNEVRPVNKKSIAPTYRRTGPYKVEFDHGGRTFTLFKRRPDPKLPWQIKFEHDRQVVFRSVGTNDIAVGISRAITKFIDPALCAKWNIVDGTRSKRAARTSLKEVFEHYDTIAMISPRAAATNKLCLMQIFKVVRDDENLQPENVYTDQLSRQLVKDYQRAMVRKYEALVPAEKRGDESAVREARDRADRTSRSVVNQARSVFSRRNDFIEEYLAAGLTVPECVNGFNTCKRQGKNSKANYHAPADSVMRAIFANVQSLQQSDLNAFVCFWLALGTGARRGEIARMQKKHFRDVDGVLWVSGGMGKDGEVIQVGVQERAVAIIRERLSALKEPDDFILAGSKTERYYDTPNRLNSWLRSQGMTDTQKVMHELRAWVGSKIYEQSPLAARDYLRHKDESTTSKSYGRYVRVKAVTNVL